MFSSSLLRRFLCAATVLAASATPFASPGVAYFWRKVGTVPVHAVQIDTSRTDVNLAVVTASGGIGHWQSWSAMIDRARPTAAITGTYFDTVSGIPIGSIGVGGKQVHLGLIGTAFAYSPAVGASIDFAPPSTRYDFQNSTMFLRAGPRLLARGEKSLYPMMEGFRDPSVYNRAKRTAVATTKAGKLLLAATEKPILLREWAATLKALGAVDAMCLDGGSSTGLYYNGKSKIVPARTLTNLLVVYENQDRYLKYLPYLNP